jgi:hypothetical protein
MAKDHRIMQDGERLSYTCENERFKTDTSKPESYSHGIQSTSRGSVFDQPLLESNGYTLWLEHVLDKKTQDSCYWLMWYGPDGISTVPMSSVLSKDDITNMARLLASFVP